MLSCSTAKRGSIQPRFRSDTVKKHLRGYNEKRRTLFLPDDVIKCHRKLQSRSTAEVRREGDIPKICKMRRDGCIQEICKKRRDGDIPEICEMNGGYREKGYGGSK